MSQTCTEQQEDREETGPVFTQLGQLVRNLKWLGKGDGYFYMSTWLGYSVQVFGQILFYNRYFCEGIFLDEIDI